MDPAPDRPKKQPGRPTERLKLDMDPETAARLAMQAKRPVNGWAKAPSKRRKTAR